MFYVLDQNVMRKPALASLVQSRPDASFVLPDTAFIEMVKSDRWDDTMRRSLAALAPAINRTFVSMAISEAIRLEREDWQPVDRATLLPEEFTACIREIFPALTAARTSPTMLQGVRARIDRLRSDLLAEEADPTAEKNRVQRLVAHLEAACGPAMAKDMRSGRMSHEAQLGVIQAKAEEILATDIGVPPDRVEAFGRSKPLILRHIYLRLRHAMWWVARGGLPTANPATVLNHRLDQEYIVTGSFFDTILTDDREALQTDTDLRLLLDDPRREDLQRAFATYLTSASATDGC
jgi:hypothetical protein